MNTKIISFVLLSLFVVACGSKKNDASADGDPNADSGSADCVPSDERNDGKDNDCDGEIDEIVGDYCAPGALNCAAISGPSTQGWPLDDGNHSDSISVGIDGDGKSFLTLNQNKEFFYHLWVANTTDGTVSKLDAKTGKELARYPSVLAKSIMNASETVFTGCEYQQSGCANKPSRTAIDQDFNAYVANRAKGKQGSLTKFADYSTSADNAEMLSRCDDRNKDGIIQTSKDSNNNGVIDMPAEFVGMTDECILWTVDAGKNEGTPRALAVGRNRDGAAGLVWVGLNGESADVTARQIVAIDPYTHKVVHTLSHTDIGDFRTYGAATNVDGTIWFAQKWVHSPMGDDYRALGFVDPVTLKFTQVSAMPSSMPWRSAYGIAVDAQGNVYVGSNEGEPIAWRYSPSTDTWKAVKTSPDHERARGVAVDANYLWVAISSEGGTHTGNAKATNKVARYTLADLDADPTMFDLPCYHPIGIGVSPDDSIWAICQLNENKTGGEPGIAARFDGTTWTGFPVGIGPYTYSDFTGFGLNFIADPGTYRFSVRGCAEGESTDWGAIVFENAGGPQTAVSAFVRSASSEATLKEQDWIGPFSHEQSFKEAPGPVPANPWLEVELRLSTSNPEQVPRVYDVDLIVTCNAEVF